ncbi:MAG: glycosyl hydrolase-related protein, partial [Christensenellales bacterium]
PDGSSCIAYKVPEWGGYGSFAMEVAGQQMKGEVADWNGADFAAKAKKYIDREFARSNTPVVVVTDAMDHEPLHHNTLGYIEKIKEMYPHCEVIHDDLNKAFSDVSDSGAELKTVEGELNETARYEMPYQHLLSNTLSSRYRLKRKNDYVDSRLTKMLEPFSVYLSENGLGNINRYIENAWQWFLQNHAHDSICGCSIDRVHKDMEYRYSQVESIYEAVFDKYERIMADGFHIVTDKGAFIRIFNPLTFGYKKIIKVGIPFRKDFPKWKESFGEEERECFLLFSDGVEVPYTVSDYVRDYKIRTVSESVEKVDMVTVCFEIELKPFGFTDIEVKPADRPVRYCDNPSYDAVMDNGILRAEINCDGTVDLYDYATEKKYARLLEFSDDGDVGDGYMSVKPCLNRRISDGSGVRTEVVTDDDVKKTVRIYKKFSLPVRAEYSVGKVERSGTYVEMDIVTTLELGKNDRFLRVNVDVENTASDHRFRLNIPTGIKGGYFVNQAFDFVERSCGITPEQGKRAECGVIEKSMQGIVGKRDGDGRGIAFVSDYGLKECGALADEKGTLVVTLFRSTSRTYTTNGEPDGQEIGLLKYAFELYPMDNTVTYAYLQQRQDILQATPRCFVSEKVIEYKTPFKVTGASVSAVKLTEDGNVAVRLYNLSDKEEECIIETSGRLYECNMLEEVTEPIDRVILPPHRIKTVKIVRAD